MRFQKWKMKTILHCFFRNLPDSWEDFQIICIATVSVVLLRPVFAPVIEVVEI